MAQKLKQIPSIKDIEGWFNLLLAFDEEVRKRHKGIRGKIPVNEVEKLVNEAEKLNKVADYLSEIFVSQCAFLHKRMIQGDVRAAHIVFKALGTTAFHLPWFVDGVCQLLLQGKTLQFTLPKNDKKTLVKERKTFRKVSLILREIKKGSKGDALIDKISKEYPFNSSEGISDSTIKTLLYRDYPEKTFVYLFKKTFESLMLYLTCYTDLFPEG